MAAGGGPTQRIPAAITASAKSAFSARKPNPGWMASAPADRAASTTAAMSSRSSASGPVVSGAMARIPSRSHVRRMRVAISPRLAMNRVRIGPGESSRSRRRPSRAGRAPVAPPSAPPSPVACCATNASIASVATRHRPPTRLAGSRPLAIQRWTERVVAPTRAAAWLGLNSSRICVAIVAYARKTRQRWVSCMNRARGPGRSARLRPSVPLRMHLTHQIRVLRAWPMTRSVSNGRWPSVLGPILMGELHERRPGPRPPGRRAVRATGRRGANGPTAPHGTLGWTLRHQRAVHALDRRVPDRAVSRDPAPRPVVASR